MPIIFDESSMIHKREIKSVNVGIQHELKYDKNYYVIVSFHSLNPIDMTLLAQSLSDVFDADVSMSGYRGVRPSGSDVSFVSLWQQLKRYLYRRFR